MRVNTKRVAFAVAAGWAAWYAVCYLLVVVAPDQTRAVLSFAFHYELSGDRNVSVGGFLGGLLLTTVWIAIFAATVAGIFNGLGESRNPGVFPDRTGVRAG